ncbi:MAG: OmpH family outer membrane protein [Prevotellaceae bacterium]|jgi:outer membrane protein|nr:OmpH family outer membrane protein [Prevotellaceae bacterium]
MKKIILTFALFVAVCVAANAQKFALVDMEYIMKNIPAYETATEQLNQVSKKWQQEVEALNAETEKLYKNYQTELVFLSPDMKNKRENEIVEKEKAAQELKRKYFGPDGELFKKRESLMKPIQDEIYNAIKSVSEEKAYQLIVDKSSAMNIIYASPKIDISDEVLSKMGYAK